MINKREYIILAHTGKSSLSGKAEIVERDPALGVGFDTVLPGGPWPLDIASRLVPFANAVVSHFCHHNGVDTKLNRADLAATVYQILYAHTESFEVDDIGPDLAYLMGAILTGDQVSLSEDRPLRKLLAEHFHATHPVWRHVTHEEDGNNTAEPALGQTAS